MSLASSDTAALNVILVGTGHYATGESVLSGQRFTDKDHGVLLPSLLFLRERGRVARISLCGQNGDKFGLIRRKIAPWAVNPGLDVRISTYPEPGQVDPKAYLRALDEMPSPRAAIIAVPDHLHVEVMLACAERHIPFLVVKPAVTRLNEFYAVLKNLPAGLLAMVDYHKVYDEANLLLLHELQQGQYGRLMHVSSLMTQRRDMIEIYRRWLMENPGTNINHYLGSHYIHMTGFLSGATPIDVRATQQHGFIRDTYEIEVADTIQTQVRWRMADGHVFSSYHIAGWTDPSQTESMTYQELHLLTENGHVFSDQRYRGTRKVLVEGGLQAPNPYFFNLTPNLLGEWNLVNKYGFQSVAHFLELAATGDVGREGVRLPTFADSENVTAVLEAADLSLANDSRVVRIESETGRLGLRMASA